jgi:predicted branched-subunit amino acid permease
VTDQAQEPAPDARPPGAAFRAGLVDALSFPAWVVAAALVGIGPLARDAGYPLGAAVLSTMLVWAGPAQVILFGMLASGASLPAVAFAVGLSAVRLMPMTVAILPLLRGPRAGLLTQMAAAHFITVTVWVETMRRLPGLPAAERVPYFFGFASACLGLSALATGAGYVLAGEVPPAFAATLLFISPIFFSLALLDGARRAADYAAIAAGFALAPVVTALAGRGFALLAAGLVGGTAAFVLHRRVRGRAA